MLSIQKDFLFIHVPKTGGNSIQQILSTYSKDKITFDAECQDGIERFDVVNKKYALKKHSTLIEYKMAIKPSVYKNLYKFSTIRNPWDRMISFYFSPNRGVTEWNRDEFIKSVDKAKPLSDYISTRSFFEIKYGKTINKYSPIKKRTIKKDIDYLIRFEHLNEDFKMVCENINIPYRPLSHRNKSNRKHYSLYYDEELKDLVEAKFKEEIEFRNYLFEKL